MKHDKKLIEQLFPKTMMITQEIIDSKRSIGTQLLQSFIPAEYHEDIFWGLSIGQVKNVMIKTEQEVVHNGKKLKVPFYLDSSIQKPTEVTFTIR